MANIIRIKRRWSGGTGGPASMKSGELAYNGTDDILYIGFGDDGSGNATSVKVMAGFGASVMLTTDQVISGIKTFNSSPLVPTATAGDNTTKAASTAFVQAAITAATLNDGDYGDVTISGSGTSITIDADAVTNVKLANMPTNTIKGNNTGGTANPADLTAAQVKTMLSLGNVDNTSDANKPVSTAQQAALDLKVDIADIGVANGVAGLDGTGKVPSAQLPAFVDDVLEYANLAALPGTGATGVLYVTLDTNKVYRWSGTVYVEISGSPGSTDAVPEGSSNLYFTDARARTAVIAATIVNGDTTHSPSGDAVFDALALKAPLASPTFTGTPAAPTASAGTNTTQLATTAFVTAAQALNLKVASNLSDLANATTARTNLGLGTMATQNAAAVAITGGTIDGVTIDGGTY